jgi:holo-[acyl-carrier protein] synthase
VGREPAGRPLLLLHGRAAEIARAMGVEHSSLSITHTDSQATALVILERRSLEGIPET